MTQNERIGKTMTSRDSEKYRRDRFGHDNKVLTALLAGHRTLKELAIGFPYIPAAALKEICERLLAEGFLDALKPDNRLCLTDKGMVHAEKALYAERDSADKARCMFDLIGRRKSARKAVRVSMTLP
jgi:hypothetical protein